MIAGMTILIDVFDHNERYGIQRYSDDNPYLARLLLMQQTSFLRLGKICSNEFPGTLCSPHNRHDIGGHHHLCRYF